MYSSVKAAVKIPTAKQRTRTRYLNLKIYMKLELSKHLWFLLLHSTAFHTTATVYSGNDYRKCIQGFTNQNRQRFLK